MIPRYLIHWVNSIPDKSPQCALASDVSAFEDGSVLIQIAEHVGGHSVPFAGTSTSSAGKIQSVLSYFGDKHGWDEMPSVLQSGDAATKIVEGCRLGESKELVALLEYMFIMSARIIKDKENVTENSNSSASENEDVSARMAADLAVLKKKAGTKGTAASSSSNKPGSRNPPQKQVPKKQPSTKTTSISSEKDATPASSSSSSIGGAGRGQNWSAGAKLTGKSTAGGRKGIDMRSDTIRNSYQLRRVHSRGKDTYAMDEAAAREMEIVEAAAHEELGGAAARGGDDEPVYQVVDPWQALGGHSECERQWRGGAEEQSVLLHGKQHQHQHQHYLLDTRTASTTQMTRIPEPRVRAQLWA